jgi:hypothetical protein
METKHVKRLWESFAMDSRSSVSCEKLTKYFEGVLSDYYESAIHVRQDAAQPSTEAVAWDRRISGLGIDLICRVIVDNMLYSIWNRPDTDIREVAAPTSAAADDKISKLQVSKPIGDSQALSCPPVSQISFSAFDEFTRQSFFAEVENKLRCLFELEKNAVDPNPIVSVRVFFKSSKDEIKIVVFDPYSGWF